MKPSKSSFYLDFKELTCTRNLVIIAILYGLLLGLAQIKISEDKVVLKELEITNRLEKLKAEQFNEYVPYSVYGIRLFTMPSPMNFLSIYKVNNGLIAAVDSGTALKIYETKKEYNILPDPSDWLVNFTGMLLVCGYLLVMLLGYETFNDVKELRSFCTIKNYGQVFATRIYSRVIFITAVLIGLALSVYLLAWVNGLSIPGFYFLIYWGLAILVINFPLFLGTVSGALKTRLKRIACFICLFLSVTLLSLFIIVKLVKGFSNNISEPQTEYDKVKILMAFEKSGVQKFDNVRSGDEVNKFMQSYLDNQLVILEDIERKHKQDIVDRVDLFKTLSCLVPSTFFLTTVNELCGNGYDTYFGFYGLTEEMKRGFIKFFFEKEYFSAHVSGKVDSFIKGDENIYLCRSSLPSNLWAGIILTLLYSAGLIALTHYFTYRKIFPVKQKLEDEDDVHTFIRQGEPNTFFTNSELVKAKFYNHFSGKENLNGDIGFIPDGDLDNIEKVPFFYLGPVSCFKHISSTSLHMFFFGEKPDQNMEKWEVLLKYALTNRVVIFDGFMESVDPRRLTDAKKQLHEQEVYGLIITSDYYFALEFVDDPRNLKFKPNDPLGEFLETRLKEKNK
ncbi:MAG: transporter permease subunit [Acidobacteriota bacterium]|nr:transporter permease subunit [Acidobacteriota bacterium]